MIIPQRWCLFHNKINPALSLSLQCCIVKNRAAISSIRCSTTHFIIPRRHDYDDVSKIQSSHLLWRSHHHHPIVLISPQQQLLHDNHCQIPQHRYCTHRHSSSSSSDFPGSTTTENRTSSLLSDEKAKGGDDKSSPDQYKIKILSNSLNHVEEHGWTEDALVAGAISSNLPLSMVGLINGKGTDLVSFFMGKCNGDLRHGLVTRSKDWDTQGLTVPDRIRESIWLRLSLVAPFIRNKRWHEAMAIGAAPPYNTVATAYQLENMVDIIVENGCKMKNMGRIEKLAIGAVYVSTELHMLADDSYDFVATKEFLNNRVSELKLVADNGAAAILSGDTVVAASAVATSLGGAIISLAEPSLRNVRDINPATILSQFSTLFIKREDSSLSAINVDDLPPFETDIKKKN